MNDKFAHLSGARTLCVNPRFIDPFNKTQWTHQIKKMDSLKEILPYIFSDGMLTDVHI